MSRSGEEQALTGLQPSGTLLIVPIGKQTWPGSTFIGGSPRGSALHGPDRDNAIGAFVRERRKANRLTQLQLAELTAVGLRFVAELERGKPSLRLETVDKVLAAFGRRLGVVEAKRDGA
jgi:y4mF family transcriptional regulator